MPAPPRFSAELVGSSALTPQVRRLVFARQEPGPLAFEPGQWVNLLLPVEGCAAPLRRAYSIASPPSTDGTFELAVTRVEGGPGSTFLHALEVGATIEGEGPQGFFTRDPAFTQPTLFVATGTGFTPLRSMLLAAAGAGSATRTHLVLGARHETDLLYRSEIEAFAAHHDWFTHTFTLSRPTETWRGASGYVQAHLRPALEVLSAHGEPHVFACGLQRMVSAVRELVRKDLGFPRERMHAERFD